MDAAAILAIREIDFFRLAYERWFGKEIEPQVLERIFAAYMFHQKVPPWVRHLSRDIVTRGSDGDFDSRAIGADRFKRRDPPPRLAKFSVGFTVAVFLLYTLALADMGNNREISSPMYCQGGAGLNFMTRLAYGIHGKRPSPCEKQERK